MSYILDALRKAERDRNLGRVPTLEDVTQAPPSHAAEPLRPGRLLAVAACVLGLLVLIYLVYAYLRQTPPPPAPAMPTPPAAELVTAPIPAPIEAPAPEAAAPDEGQPALDPDTQLSSLDELMDGEEPAAAFEEASEIAAAEGEAAEDFFMTPEEAIAAGDTAPLEADPDPRPQPMPEQPAVNNAPAGVPAPKVASGPILLRDMPSDYRSAFPQLRVDVHVYDADRARRWALINGKKYLEGSTLAEGPRVAQITAEGIVFDYRGMTTLFPLNR
ncbi:MAG: general secretion pathway protein GspB [Panacagrimonas sp.]